MTVPAIFHDLLNAGVEFEARGEGIRWRNAAGRMTTKVIEMLRPHKADIICLLTDQAASACQHLPVTIAPGLFPPPCPGDFYGISEETTPPPAVMPSAPDDGYPNADGYYRTWKGRLLRPDEWRELSAWGKHGPAGRLFCGICWAWVIRDDDCCQSECQKAEWGVA